MHLGVYAYRRDTVLRITGDRVTQGTLEEVESLEQLRWLECGLSIDVVVVEHGFVGINTQDDYAAFVRRTLAAAEDTGAGVGYK